ncbi:MAG: thiol:disulfide interchange protein DsbA/DsbL [Porticoccaceae bacterium]|nr:thiol:disulfide interchange protein DsbA/DsbL [Porticoccaceae bacterium]
MSKLFSVVATVFVLTVAVGCQAGSGEKFEAGKHYFVLPQPVRTSDPKKVEVAEVFWYGCPHCFQYTSKVKEWADGLPDDVTFVRNPSTLGRKTAEIHTRAYYTAKAMGNLDAMHGKLFSAYHVKNNHMRNEREISDVFVEAGVERDQFSGVFNSFGVISQSMQAQSRATGYRVTGTPCIIVNGKYRITGESAGTNDGMLEVAEFLIEKERQAKK